eukprot:2290372-Pleurochrysis_carterae.AAC.3
MRESPTATVYSDSRCSMKGRFEQSSCSAPERSSFMRVYATRSMITLRILVADSSQRKSQIVACGGERHQSEWRCGVDRTASCCEGRQRKALHDCRLLRTSHTRVCSVWNARLPPAVMLRPCSRVSSRMIGINFDRAGG